MSESAASSGGLLQTITPTWQAPALVRALCTTRLGGVSQPPYDAMNLGLHVGDDETRVRQNRALMVRELGLPQMPHWLSQVHGTRVVQVGATLSGVPSERSNAQGEADGAWTDARDVVIAVMTADCLPVVVTDGEGSRVAVAHAGWRGLAGGVLDAALKPFPSESVLHVWLGPAIGPRAFEVGGEVRDTFVDRDPEHALAFVERDEPGKYLADIYALARREMTRSRPGQEIQFSGGDRCTHQESRLFHSHRRDGVRSGRLATVAWLCRPSA